MLKVSNVPRCHRGRNTLHIELTLEATTRVGDDAQCLSIVFFPHVFLLIKRIDSTTNDEFSPISKPRLRDGCQPLVTLIPGGAHSCWKALRRMYEPARGTQKCWVKAEEHVSKIVKVMQSDFWFNHIQSNF